MNIMKSFFNGKSLLALGLLMAAFNLHAAIDGIESTNFNLYAKTAQISTPDGDSFQIWGFATTPDGDAQYPGPTLIVDPNDAYDTATPPNETNVRVTLHNVNVPQPVSLDFPGQNVVTKSCTDGADADAVCGDTVAMGSGDTITYSFSPHGNPGTFLYQGGNQPQVQVEMGLFGALIVRPASDPTGRAYDHDEAAYDREFLFLLSEMDPRPHYLAENGVIDTWDNADYRSVLWFINGRNAPDTLAADHAPQLPHQPYGSMVQMHPGDRLLLRVLNLGRNQHPLHLHGNHFSQIARDGNVLGDDPATGTVEMIPVEDYTLNAIPGSTADLIFEWTGRGMGWDIYGHTAGDGSVCEDGDGDLYDDTTHEYCPDHGKPLPVVIPENQDLAFGGFYGGSPFLGSEGALPIGEGGLNPFGGMVFMWHSHSERELANNDIFPGGMLTMLIVQHPEVCIPPEDDCTP